MASLVTALPADIEFVYVNAPSLATGDFGWWHEGFDGWERTRDWARYGRPTRPRAATSVQLGSSDIRPQRQRPASCLCSDSADRRVTGSGVRLLSEVFQQPDRLGGAVVLDKQVVMVETSHDIAAKPPMS